MLPLGMKIIDVVMLLILKEAKIKKNVLLYMIQKMKWKQKLMNIIGEEGVMLKLNVIQIILERK